MAAIASTGKVKIPAVIEVGRQKIAIGTIEVAVDIRAVQYDDAADGLGLHAVLDLSVEG